MKRIKLAFGFGRDERIERAEIAARELTEIAHGIEDTLHPYETTDDPFMALLVDMHNRRTARQMVRYENK